MDTIQSVRRSQALTELPGKAIHGTWDERIVPSHRTWMAKTTVHPGMGVLVTNMEIPKGASVSLDGPSADDSDEASVNEDPPMH